MGTPGESVKRILIVEDEPAIVKMCQRVLSSDGIDVEVATNGKVAQDMIGAKQYDLFLIDIRMPIVSGKDLYEWLKKSHPQLAGRVIFTSGDVMSGDTKDFLERDGLSCLSKPFDSAELKAAVNGALNSPKK